MSATHPVVAVGAIIVDGTRVVLVKRGKEPLKGRWSLPGGRLELGEALEAATVREAKEETGLDVAIEAFVTMVERIHRDPTGTVLYHFVLADYRCRAVGGALRAGDDADDAEWVEIGDLPRYGVAEATIDVVRQAMGSEVAPRPRSAVV